MSRKDPDPGLRVFCLRIRTRIGSGSGLMDSFPCRWMCGSGSRSENFHPVSGSGRARLSADPIRVVAMFCCLGWESGSWSESVRLGFGSGRELCTDSCQVIVLSSSYLGSVRAAGSGFRLLPHSCLRTERCRNPYSACCNKNFFVLLGSVIHKSEYRIPDPNLTLDGTVLRYGLYADT